MEPNIYKGAGIYNIGAEGGGGGGGQPLPENWEKILGITFSKRATAFYLDAINLNSDDLEFITRCSFPLQYFSANGQTLNMSIVNGAEIYTRYGNYGGGYNGYIDTNTCNGGSSQQKFINATGTAFDASTIITDNTIKEYVMKNNILKLGANQATINYVSRNITRLYMFKEITNSGVYYKSTLYEATIKKDDEILAHIIPVKNTLTSKLNFFEEITGQLFNSDLLPSEESYLEAVL